MKPLMILAAGLAACVSASSGHSTDGPPSNVADGPPTGVANASPGKVTGADGSPSVPDAAPIGVPDAAPIIAADAAPIIAADAAPIIAADAAPVNGADGSLTNVALNGTATASSVWENNPKLLPENVIDDSAYDDVEQKNFWLLPNETAGWWQVDLGAEFTIHTIKIFNCNNGEANDRGTKDFRLEIRDATQDVVRATSGMLPFTSMSSVARPIVPRVLDFAKPVRGRYVKIYVDTWYPTRTDPSWPYPKIDSSDPGNQGGGLNEVQVFATE